MVKVLEVRAGGQVVVDGSGLYRVVYDGGVLDELLTPTEAESFVDSFNACCPPTLACAISYADLPHASSS